MSECKSCKMKEETKYYGKIWLSNDGYCSVCNNKFKDRKRQIKGMDNFVDTIKIKEGKNTHLTTWGARLTDYKILRHKIKNKYKQGVGNQMVKNILENKKRSIMEWIQNE